MNLPENMPELTAAEKLHRFALRPAYLVKVICQMILGLGIAIALVAKVYMFVLTDHQCVADSFALGNKIRCGNTLAIMAYGLALSAGFELAFRLFSDGIHAAIDPLILGVASAFLLIVSSLALENASWQIAMLLTSLTITVAALLFCRERFSTGTDGAGTSDNVSHANEQHSSTATSSIFSQDGSGH